MFFFTRLLANLGIRGPLYKAIEAGNLDAMQLAGELGDRNALKPLIKIVKSTNHPDDTRIRARIALEKIAGRRRTAPTPGLRGGGTGSVPPAPMVDPDATPPDYQVNRSGRVTLIPGAMVSQSGMIPTANAARAARSSQSAPMVPVGFAQTPSGAPRSLGPLDAVPRDVPVMPQRAPTRRTPELPGRLAPDPDAPAPAPAMSVRVGGSSIDRRIRPPSFTPGDAQATAARGAATPRTGGGPEGGK